MAIVISIGRGVGNDGAELNDQDWADYKDAVEHSLWQAYSPEVYFTGEGFGNGEWGAEASWTIIASEPQFGDERRDLEDRLLRIRALYGQEAVAVTEGPTRFV